MENNKTWSDPIKSLKFGESYFNATEDKDVQVLYYNAMGIKQTSFIRLKTGQTITKTQHDTIIHIFRD